LSLPNKSFLPLIGAPIIWIPVVLYHFSQAHTSTAIIILVAGLLVSNLDNILRPWIQNRVGNIHPLITIFGVLIGLSLFGISGLVMGPLLIALAINMSAMALEAVRSS
jgi:predicted PurR-regulated permease PerM